MWIIGPNLLDLIDLLPDPLIHLVVVERIEHLVEVHLWCAVDLLHVLVQRGEKAVEQVLVGSLEVLAGLDNARSFRHLEHVVVTDAELGQLLGIFFEFLISKEDGLVIDRHARFDFEEAFQVLYRGVSVDLQVVELVLVHQVLYEQLHGLFL